MFNTFYSYLIGEGIEPLDVRSHDGDFIGLKDIGSIKDFGCLSTEK